MSHLYLHAVKNNYLRAKKLNLLKNVSKRVNNVKMLSFGCCLKFLQPFMLLFIRRGYQVFLVCLYLCINRLKYNIF